MAASGAALTGLPLPVGGAICGFSLPLATGWMAHTASESALRSCQRQSDLSQRCADMTELHTAGSGHHGSVAQRPHTDVAVDSWLAPLLPERPVPMLAGLHCFPSCLSPETVKLPTSCCVPVLIGRH